MPEILRKTKLCVCCGKVFVKTNFYTYNKGDKVYYRPYCKNCNNKKMREYQKLKSNMPIEALELYLEKFGISLLNIVKNINKERGLI
jgi:hypothetical protein